MLQGRRIFSLLFLLVFVIAACTPAPTPADQPPIPTAGETNTPFTPNQATATTTNEETHTVMGEYGTPEPVTAGGSQAGLADNQARFGSKFATGDMFLISMAGVQPPPAGQSYQGWLVSEQGELFGIGVLEVTPDGRIRHEWVSPNGENLLINYHSLQITLEGETQAESPQGRSFYYGGLEPAAWQTARNLFVENIREPATPLNNALVPGLISQLEVAIQHIHNAENAAKIGALAEMRNHMEHTINIIEGASGPRFRDYNSDGAAQNPGDGFGVKGYASEIAALVDQAEARNASQLLIDHLDEIQGICEQIIALEEVQPAAKHLEEIAAIQAKITTLVDTLVAQTFVYTRFDVIPDTSNTP